jgi:hypothetical protein
MKLTARNTHRDLAYFYLGLIIAFSISGIFLNHRQSWNPRRYKVETQNVKMPPVAPDSVNEQFVQQFSAQQGVADDVRRFQVVEGKLRISYVNYDAEVDLATGQGTLTHYRTTPLLGQMVKLHIDTSKWWIYYSDIFGAAMLTIALTGMFIQTGDNSFQKRGWKLALAGIIFPLVFLFLLS